MSQFRTNPDAVDEAAGVAWVRGDEAHHMVRVFRARPGEAVNLFDGTGRRWRGVVACAGSPVRVEKLEPLPANEPPHEIHLVQAVPKGERWEWILEKGTELGVSVFHPVLTRRTVVRVPPQKAAARRARWQRIVEAAVRQCERAKIPKVEPLQDLTGALRNLGPAGRGEIRIVWSERSRSAPPGCAEISPRKVVLAVGPEGGWDPEELGFLERAGFVPAGLGPRILRAETAALVGVAVVQARWGDLVAPGPAW